MKIEILRFDNPNHDLRPVNNFLIEHALRAKDCLPPPMLLIFAVAYNDASELVACCGASTSTKEPFHLEKIYRFNESAKNVLSDRDILCEIGRWFSTDATAALPVLKNLIEYLQGLGIQRAICELKAATVRRAYSLGLSFQELDAELMIDNVDATEKIYYLDLPPKLYLLDFNHIAWKY